MLRSAVWLLLTCVSLWGLERLSHFIIPIPQREKQVRRGGRTCQDCPGVSSHSAGLTPKVFPRSSCILFLSCSLASPGLWYLCYLLQLSKAPQHPGTRWYVIWGLQPSASLSFPRRKLPINDRLHFLMKPWVSSLRSLKNLSQSEQLLSFPLSAVLLPRTVSLPGCT